MDVCHNNKKDMQAREQSTKIPPASCATAVHNPRDASHNCRKNNQKINQAAVPASVSSCIARFERLQINVCCAHLLQFKKAWVAQYISAATRNHSLLQVCDKFFLSRRSRRRASASCTRDCMILGASKMLHPPAVDAPQRATVSNAIESI